MASIRLWFIFLLQGLLIPQAYAAAVTVDIPLNQDVDVTVTQYRATGDSLILWLPSESGILEQEKKAAEKLAASGVEVWFADLHSAYFLPLLMSSTDRIPAQDVAVLLQKVRTQSKRKIYLAGSGRGALLALRTAHAWQKKYPHEPPLAGVVLISPKLYVETPEPGKEGKLMPVVDVTNQPIFILQPDKSPWYWKMDRIIPALKKSGSDVYLRVLHGVRDRFYYRPDATRQEDRFASRLSVFILQALTLLEPYAGKPRAIRAVSGTVPAAVEGRKERILRAYQGNPLPPALQLETLTGSRMNLRDLKGKVVLVNFWASWCPPCVHEMPSMERLGKRLEKQGFVILGVNMAEDAKTIQRFLKEKVKVSFPILLDRDGAALKRWKVFAFPTSYVIDRQGRIRLALFGSIDWEQVDVLRKLEKLLHESGG